MQIEHIKQIARQMVLEGGLVNLSRADLCKRANIPDGSFSHIMRCNFSEFLKMLKDENIPTPVYAAKKNRLNPELRTESILAAALTLAIRDGYDKVRRVQVAEAAGVSEALISARFGTMAQLKRAIMRAAIAKEIPEIIAQGIAAQDRHALKAPPALKRQAIELLAQR